MKDNFTLQLHTKPAASLANQWTPSDFHPYRKELIKVGNYLKASTGQAFEVTIATLVHWAKTFHSWIAAGNKVGIPLGHEHANEPEKNAGWVTNMFVEGNSLFSTMELLDPTLALTTDVSIFVPAEFTDGKGHRYVQPIQHVALTTSPVIPGLGKFTELSLSKGDNTMDPKVLAKLLGMTEASTEEQLTAEITKLKTPVVPATTIAASLPVVTVDPLLAKVVGENRSGKLTTLLNAGLITPAVKDLIDKRYVESTALTLSLSKGGDDGFDLLVEVLTHNKPGDLLLEKSGPQLLELANTRAQQPTNPDMQRRREAAKNQPGWVVP